MKVNIGRPPTWMGPFQIAEKILFWKDRDDDAVYALGKWLAEDSKGDDSWLSNLCNFFYVKRKRTVTIRIDGYDTWNADNTLALIIVPLLKKLRDQKPGAPNVADEDVPENLRSTAAPELTEDQKDTGHTDDNWHKRWAYVLDEMIWAFEQHADPDWEDKFYSGEVDTYFEKVAGTDCFELKNGPDHTFKVDREGVKKYLERMANGRRLFAKYYESLWT